VKAARISIRRKPKDRCDMRPGARQLVSRPMPARAEPGIGEHVRASASRARSRTGIACHFGEHERLPSGAARCGRWRRLSACPCRHGGGRGHGGPMLIVVIVGMRVGAHD